LNNLPSLKDLPISDINQMGPAVTLVTILKTRQAPEEILFPKADTGFNRPPIIKPGPNLNDIRLYWFTLVWQITQPQWGWRLVSLQMNFGHNDIKAGCGVLLGVQRIPAPQPDCAPLFVFKLFLFIWLRPGFRLFEGKTCPVYTRPTPPPVGSGFAIQYPVSIQAAQDGPRFLLQRSKKVVIAVVTISHNNIQPTFLLLQTGLTQGFNLFDPHCNATLVCSYPFRTDCW
jgi:hypothetical protein